MKTDQIFIVTWIFYNVYLVFLSLPLSFLYRHLYLVNSFAIASIIYKEILLPLTSQSLASVRCDFNSLIFIHVQMRGTCCLGKYFRFDVPFVIVWKTTTGNQQSNLSPRVQNLFSISLAIKFATAKNDSRRLVEPATSFPFHLATLRINRGILMPQ